MSDTARNPGVGGITLTGRSASISVSTVKSPGVGSIGVSGYSAGASVSSTVSPGVGRITITRYKPYTGSFNLWGHGGHTAAAPPVGLPAFLAVTHAVETVGVYGEIAYGSGHTRRRRMRVSAPQIVSVMWDLNQAQMDLVHVWYEDNLLGGTLPFLAEVANLGPGLRNVSAQWVEPPSATPDVTERWLVSGRILLGAESTLAIPAKPAKLFNFIKKPPRGRITLTGYPPSIQTRATTSPDAGSIVISGQIPLVLQPSLFVPGAGSIVLTGMVPIVGADSRFSSPSSGAITITGCSVTALGPVGCVGGPVWTSRTTPSQRPAAIAYGGGVYVIGGNNSANTTAGYNVSTDSGATWTNYSHSFANDSSGRVLTHTLAYGAGLFVTVGNSVDHVTSPDGVTWTDRTHSGFNSASLKFHDGYFLNCTNAASSSIWRSTDGITFTAKTMPASRSWTSTAAGGGKAVAVSSDGNTAVSSDLGLTWSAGGALPASGSPWYVTTDGAGTWFAVMFNSTSGAISTNNGASWTAKNISGAATKNWKDVHYVQGVFMAMQGNTPYTSPDGNGWSDASNSISGGTSWEIAFDGLGSYAAADTGAVANVTTAASGVCTAAATPVDSRTYAPAAGLITVEGLAPNPNPDPHFANVSLLVHFNTGGITVDSSVNHYSVDANSITSGTTQVKYGAQSAILNGSSTYISYFSAAPLDLTTGDFTIEMWAYRKSTATGNKTLIAKQTGTGFYPWALTHVAGTSKLNFQGFDTSNVSAFNITQSDTLSNDAWHHIAMTRSGNTFTLWVDGVSKGTATSSAALRTNSSDSVYVGASGAGTTVWDGYLDDLRITKGVARYTATFTPPTEQMSDS